MKLFTRKELKLDAQVESEAIRAKEIQVVQSLKEKLTLLNNVDEEYKVKLENKRVELAEAELKLRTFLANEEKEVILLEERRKQALTPIVEEKQQLDSTKIEIQSYILSLDAKNEELKRAEAQLRQKENEIQSAERALLQVRQETADFLDRQKKDAESLMEQAKSTVASLQHEETRAQKVIKDAEDKRADAERATNIAKGAMIAADQRIEMERKEQQKTDDKRKMLKVAIDEMKKKGLWHKQHEMIIK